MKFLKDRAAVMSIIHYDAVVFVPITAKIPLAPMDVVVTTSDSAYGDWITVFTPYRNAA